MHVDERERPSMRCTICTARRARCLRDRDRRRVGCDGQQWGHVMHEGRAASLDTPTRTAPRAPAQRRAHGPGAAGRSPVLQRSLVAPRARVRGARNVGHAW